MCIIMCPHKTTLRETMKRKKMSPKQHLKKIFGNDRKIGAVVGISQQAVNSWGDSVPDNDVYHEKWIEAAKIRGYKLEIKDLRGGINEGD